MGGALIGMARSTVCPGWHQEMPNHLIGMVHSGVSWLKWTHTSVFLLPETLSPGALLVWSKSPVALHIACQG